ncbi:Ig-like domain repeat protein, partial [Methanobrevibacter sp.]|uniref:Ig-like domain repeat protein n=1 Tax=Methanobrevibacter sp. TaxID=66852 RepID=UPI0038663B66
MDQIISNNELDSSLNSQNNLNTNFEGNVNLGDSIDSKVIYVGSNDKDGDGSFDNPFRNFKLACDNVSGENNVTIYVSEGTYELGEGFHEDASEGSLKCLIFNNNNLNIIGNGTVIIKNKYDYDGYNAEAFSLTSNSANFTFTNLIFDASNRNWYYVDFNDGYDFFMPFFGEAELGIFNNCSFIGFGHKAGIVISELTYNSKFINCYFECGSSGLFEKDGLSRGTWGYVVDTFTLFENCTFNIPNSNGNSFTKFPIDLPWNISISNVWFGQNNIPNWMYPNVQWPSETTVADFIIPVNRYAIFNVTQNYLGNNQYEILGKLTWNGTDDQEGMENFRTMSVTLKSTTGDINQTATLVNGNFRAIYTSSATNHKVTAKLHNEEIELEFTNVNITANPINIYYGEDQNITFNFTQPITANVTVTVSNGSYNKSERVEIIDKNSLIYTVPDTLKEGTYDVEINLAENNLFGFNTTTLTVSKVSDYTFDVATGDVKVGENATISITLPEDVNGTVVVKFGNDTKELSANQTMTVNFTNLNATTYSVNVSYSGNDKYVSLDKAASVTVNKADSNLEIEDAIFTYGDVIAIPFNVTNANGVTVSVLNKDDDEVATASSQSGTINLDTLPAGKYTLEVTTIVGSNYEWVSKTIDLTINKANSSIDIQDKEFSYAEDAVIKAVTENSTGDVIVTLTDENNTEIAVTVSGDNITLPKLNTGKYTLTVTTNPDENHNNVTKTATITISKITPSMKVVVEPAENITAKDDVTLTISLPSDATGEVTVKVNGKKTDQLSANETITLNLNNHAVGDYFVDIIYSGNQNYESDSATKEFTISKAKTSITAEQIAFEVGNASTIEVTVQDVESGIVLVDVAGKKFYGDIDSGKAIVTIEGVDAGNYTANIKFFGDEKYKETTTTADVKVSEDKIITELKEQLEEANAKVDNLTGDLADANAKVGNLTGDLADANAKV